ncbi:MAG: MBL fold metallo-hydrolase [Deltaproteobacteria bacterium]|nr:MBL fold metallo-hydrolase [Deltaproteobacteria bacterium]MBW2363829.1 MBL fold metallo-hydrolase [Deltaproteobacteria bacterium]
MKICIHRGASEIGGSCVEIESQGKRLVLDIGLPLDADIKDTSLPDVSGLAKPDKSLLGIFISHPHLDHYGLAEKLNYDVPILIGPAAKRIIEAAKKFIPSDMNFGNIIDLEHKKPIELGPFTLTPYLSPCPTFHFALFNH